MSVPLNLTNDQIARRVIQIGPSFPRAPASWTQQLLSKITLLVLLPFYHASGWRILAQSLRTKIALSGSINMAQTTFGTKTPRPGFDEFSEASHPAG